MHFENVKQIEAFLETANKCKGEVILKSVYGDQFNLKSRLSQYIAVGALLGNHGDELELFCSNRDDELMMLSFLKKYMPAA